MITCFASPTSAGLREPTEPAAGVHSRLNPTDDAASILRLNRMKQGIQRRTGMLDDE
jgi:hypothetical protein